MDKQHTSGGDFPWVVGSFIWALWRRRKLTSGKPLGMIIACMLHTQSLFDLPQYLDKRALTQCLLIESRCWNLHFAKTLQMHSQAYQMPLLQLSAETTFEKDDADLGSQSCPSTHQKASSIRFIGARHMSFSERYQWSTAIFQRCSVTAVCMGLS